MAISLKKITLLVAAFVAAMLVFSSAAPVAVARDQDTELLSKVAVGLDVLYRVTVSTRPTIPNYYS